MDSALTALAMSLSITERGVAIIESIINSEPARRVKASSAAGNKAVRYPSRKMGFVIQAESELEFCGVLMKEYSSDVLKYYDQPPSIDLVYQSGTRTVRTHSTLDYFVVSESFIGYEEWKPSSELMKISEKRPDHFYFDESLRRFISPALERYLSGTGLAYRICTDKDINSVLVQNYNFLAGYFNTDDRSQHEGYIKNLIAYLRKSKGVSISESISSGFDSDSIYSAITSNQIYFPLFDVDITNQETSYIFVDEAEWNKYKMISSMDGDKKIESSSDSFHEKLLKCKPSKIENAIFKLQQLRNLMSGKLSAEDCANS